MLFKGVKVRVGVVWRSLRKYWSPPAVPHTLSPSIIGAIWEELLALSSQYYPHTAAAREFVRMCTDEVQCTYIKVHYVLYTYSSSDGSPSF